MTTFEIIQNECEQFFEQNNLKKPDQWFILKESERFYFIEKSINRKRFGQKINCECCNREFVVREDLIKETKYCSKFCYKKIVNNKKIENAIHLNCAWCEKPITRTQSKLSGSKHELYFCSRKCKEEAQTIEGLSELHPDHYKDGAYNYSQRALKHYGAKCCDCGISFPPLLSVHHIDGNRENGDLNNLEVVCNNHHMVRHLRYNSTLEKWELDFNSLTPRDKIDEINKLFNLDGH